MRACTCRICSPVERQLINASSSCELIRMNESKKEKEVQDLAPKLWVDQYGDYLYAFALTRLVDRNAAEDVVQETFVSALHSMKNFRGHSSEKTWLTSILKHKILDHFRKKSREEKHHFETVGDNIRQLFDGKGHWKEGPEKWKTSPKKLFEQKEFLKTLYACLEELSRRVAKAFVLREIDGLSTEEICKVLDISATNCWVMLYRARTLLRQCLELNWFEISPGGAS
jgi:RNA polymerase sigma-70 factor, ECF subfamily